jgi:hypothetical protein
VAIPLLMLTWVALHNYQEDLEGSKKPFRGIAGVTSPAQEAEVGRLLTEAQGVLRSERFEANLRSLADAYPVVYARKGMQDATAHDLADYVALKKVGSRYAVVDAFVLSDDQAVDGMLASAGEGMPGLGRFADLTLDAIVPRLFRSSDIVERSCAINAAAHEYAHTISIMPVRYEAAFTDTNERRTKIANRKHPGTPVASYLIGAVAQCTWLQNHGRVGQTGLQACVQTFGTAAFNLERCRSFAEGQPVAPRPDLPRAPPPL